MPLDSLKPGQRALIIVRGKPVARSIERIDGAHVYLQGRKTPVPASRVVAVGT